MSFTGLPRSAKYRPAPGACGSVGPVRIVRSQVSDRVVRNRCRQLSTEGLVRESNAIVWLPALATHQPLRLAHQTAICLRSRARTVLPRGQSRRRRHRRPLEDGGNIGVIVDIWRLAYIVKLLSARGTSPLPTRQRAGH